MATLKLTNAEILSSLGLVMGVDRDAGQWDATTQSDARAIIRDGLRKVFNCGHLWRFLERPFVHATPTDDGYATGTVAVTGGVATLTGGTWPTWAADGILRVDGHSLYVTERTSATVLTMSHSGIVADALSTYELYRYRAALPDNFGEFIGGVVYGEDDKGKQLVGINDNQIRLFYAANFRTGCTTKYAIQAGSDTDAAKWYFLYWPTMDAEAAVTATYRGVPEDNLDADDLTVDGTVVQGGQVHSGMILSAILSAAEDYYSDGAGPHTARFDKALAASIAHDLKTQGPIMPHGMTPAQARRLSLFNHAPTYNS